MLSKAMTTSQSAILAWSYPNSSTVSPTLSSASNSIMESIESLIVIVVTKSSQSFYVTSTKSLMETNNETITAAIKETTTESNEGTNADDESKGTTTEIANPLTQSPEMSDEQTTTMTSKFEDTTPLALKDEAIAEELTLARRVGEEEDEKARSEVVSMAPLGTTSTLDLTDGSATYPTEQTSDANRGSMSNEEQTSESKTPASHSIVSTMAGTYEPTRVTTTDTTCTNSGNGTESTTKPT